MDNEQKRFYMGHRLMFIVLTTRALNLAWYRAGILALNVRQSSYFQ
jgi:hypothetical protein